MIIQVLGEYNFFYVIGGLVFTLGLVGSFFVHEETITEKPKKGYWAQMAESFRWKNLVANRDFFLVLMGISLWAIAQNVFFPYLIIYLQHYLQLDTMSSTLTIAISILVGGIALSWPLGLLIDRWGRKPVALIAVGAEMVGLILFSISKSLVPLVITGILWLMPLTAWTIATSTWSKDLFPEDKRGQFAGFYLFFWVMLPMILGPLTGGWLGTEFGIPTVINGQPGFIPTPILFQVAGIGTLLAAIPLFFVKEKKS
ncbi:MFS transporter [bacterium]|nr:MFS transporter [bacterium]